MRVTFILPGSGHNPIGGFKVIYEYANALARRDHQVTVVHTACPFKDATVLVRVKKMIRYIQRRLDGSHRPDSWFPLDSRVKTLWVPSLHVKHIPNADALVVTGWQAAEWLVSYGPAKGERFYFVQDYEHYMCGNTALRKRIGRTFSLARHLIACSPAVGNLLSIWKVGEYRYIPNGIDFNIFKLELDIEHQDRCMVGFPSRPEEFKGTRDAVEALSEVRSRLGEKLRVWTFGGRRPSYMPEWIEYYKRPSTLQLRSLYNRSAVFVVPSHYEGWGLPGAEAMACGAALVSTRNGGVDAYAIDGVTAWLVPPQRPRALADAVFSLLIDFDTRVALARRGYEHIKEFTWDRSVDALERYLIDGFNCSHL